jgi:cell division transport system ATP-binding protein
MIEFQSVSKSTIPPTPLALSDVSFNIAKGELVYLAGPSGAGKSTLMKMIAAVERPTSGRVIVNGQDIGKLQGRRALPAP